MARRNTRPHRRALDPATRPTHEARPYATGATCREGKDRLGCLSAERRKGRWGCHTTHPGDLGKRLATRRNALDLTREHVAARAVPRNWGIVHAGDNPQPWLAIAPARAGLIASALLEGSCVGPRYEPGWSESPLLRLMVDEGYRLLVHGDQRAYLLAHEGKQIEQNSIWVYRFYDEAATTFGAPAHGSLLGRLVHGMEDHVAAPTGRTHSSLMSAAATTIPPMSCAPGSRGIQPSRGQPTATIQSPAVLPDVADRKPCDFTRMVMPSIATSDYPASAVTFPSLVPVHTSA